MPRSLVVTLCAVPLIAAGCGGGSSSGSSSGSEPASTPPATPVTETATVDSGSGGQLTKTGTELAVGDVAHVTLKPFSNDVNEKRRYPVDVTVEKIEKGSLDDFKNIELDAKDKQSTPYYVTVKITNAGKAFGTKQDDPDVRID